MSAEEAYFEQPKDKIAWEPQLGAMAARAIRLNFRTNIELVQKYYDKIDVTTIAAYDGDSWRNSSHQRVQSANESRTPDSRAQIQSAIVFGITAALLRPDHAQGRPGVEQTNFDTYQMLRMNEAPAIEVHIVQKFRAAGRDGRGRDLVHSCRYKLTRSLPLPASACASCQSTPRK